MQMKIIQTTDGRHLGEEYFIDTLDLGKIYHIIGKDISFERVEASKHRATLQNSNYTIVFKIIKE